MGLHPDKATQSITTSTQTPRKCLLVLGMHRSGTSALSGVLYRLGLDFGKSIVTPSYDNPKGFYENQAIQQINNQLLSELEVTWDTLDFLPKDWWRNKKIQNYHSAAKEVIEKEFGAATYIAIKEPRISLLFPFWQEILLALDFSISCILTLRHPEEVASSLKKRNNFSYSKSHLLHLTHLFSAEEYSQKYPRQFILYQDLLKTPVEITTLIQQYFKINTIDKNIWEKEVTTFISTDLNHAMEERQDFFLLPYQVAAFQAFQYFNDADFTSLLAKHKQKHQQFLATLLPLLSVQEAAKEKELTRLKNSWSYKIGWWLLSPFRILYYLYKLVSTTSLKSVSRLFFSILKNPLKTLNKVRPEHFETLKKAIGKESPETIVKNIIKLIR